MVKWFTSLAVKRFTRLTVKRFTSLAVHKLSGQVAHKLSGQAAHELIRHPVVNPTSAGSYGMWYLCTLLGSASSSSSVCAVVSGEVHLGSSPPPIPIFLPSSLISVTGAWNGAHGWVAGICQPWGQYSIYGLACPGTHLRLKRGSWLMG